MKGWWSVGGDGKVYTGQAGWSRLNQIQATWRSPPPQLSPSTQQMREIQPIHRGLNNEVRTSWRRRRQLVASKLSYNKILAGQQLHQQQILALQKQQQQQPVPQQQQQLHAPPAGALLTQPAGGSMPHPASAPANPSKSAGGKLTEKRMAEL